MEDRGNSDESDRSTSLGGRDGDERIVEHVVEPIVDGTSFFRDVDEEREEGFFLHADRLGGGGVGELETLSHLAVEHSKGKGVSRVRRSVRWDALLEDGGRGIRGSSAGVESAFYLEHDIVHALSHVVLSPYNPSHTSVYDP